MMSEFIRGLSEISFWSKFANFHGALAMFSLILFGAGITLYFLTDKFKASVTWLKLALCALFVDLALLDIAGLVIYIIYRAEGGARTFLKANESTAWLHTIIFEHKEFLAYAPPILIFTAFLIVLFLGNSFGEKEKYHYLRLAVISSLLLALIFVLIVAGEAVLVTKVAPI